MGIIALLKKIPIDLGQAEFANKSQGKLIAFDKVPKVKKGKALDVGCRTGYWSKRLESKGYAVTSIDIEPKYAPAKKLDVDKGLPYKDNSFDLVWCSEVIEHLTDAKKSVRELMRVTKPGGKVVMTTPNSYFWIGQLLNAVGLTPKKIQNKGHKHFFSSRTLRDILPKKARVYGFFPYVIWKPTIVKHTGLLSPTFTIVIDR